VLTLRLGLLAVVAAIVLAGCTDEPSTTQSHGPLTSAELKWIRLESAWAIAIYDDTLSPATGGNTLVRECERRLAELDEPPTDRIRPAFERAKDACPLLDAPGARHRAEDVLGAVDDILEPMLRSEQDIELTDDDTMTSRADLTLSVQASRRIDDPVEVRCWSVADWERVVGEQNAWNDDSDSAEDLYGWADTSEGTIDVVIDQCNLLKRLAEEDLLEWARDDQIDAADAVATFAHEIQHFVRPDADEAEAECGAGRTLASAAVGLGATPAEAERLEALYISDIAPDLEGEYRSNTGCAE
jgi:hypothetical protein